MSYDFTPEAIRRCRRRQAAIRAEIERRYGPEQRALAYEARAARDRARVMVIQGRMISGRPRSLNINFGEVTITSGTVTVETLHRDGEGNTSIEERIKFPTAWLSMPDAEWQAALMEAVRVTRARRAATAEATRVGLVDNERAQYARLHFEALAAGEPFSGLGFTLWPEWAWAIHALPQEAP